MGDGKAYLHFGWRSGGEGRDGGAKRQGGGRGRGGSSRVKEKERSRWLVEIEREGEVEPERGRCGWSRVKERERWSRE